MSRWTRILTFSESRPCWESAPAGRSQVTLSPTTAGPAPPGAADRLFALASKDREAVLAGTVWLLAEEIAQLGAPRGLDGSPWEWRRAGRLLALRPAARYLYPLYGFTPAWLPEPGLEEILAAFTSLSEWRIASWFESTNTYLDGERPRDLLASHPDAVIEAARWHLAQPTHG